MLNSINCCRVIIIVVGAGWCLSNSNSLDTSHYIKLSIGNDRSSRILTLECLVIDNDERLFTHLIHIIDGREEQFAGRNHLRHTLFEGNRSRNILHRLFTRCTLVNLGRNIVQHHRNRSLILGRCITADRFYVALHEIDVRALRYQEATDVGIALVCIQISNLRWLNVGLGNSTIGNLHHESIYTGTVNRQCYLTPQLIYTLVCISFKGEITLHAASVDMVTPLRVTAWLVIKTDSTILGITCSSTIHIIGDDEGKVLIGVSRRRIDVQIEHGIPLLVVLNQIIL